MRKGLFDLNRDGKLDARERYIRWMTINQMINESDEEENESEWEEVDLFDSDSDY